MCNLDTFNNIYNDRIQLHINFGGFLYVTAKLNLNIGIGFRKEKIRIVLNLNKNYSLKDQCKNLRALTIY